MAQILASTLRRVTKSEAARQLGVPPKVIDKLIASGDLRTARLPTSVYAIVLQDSIDQYVKKIDGTGDGRQAS